MTLFTPAGFARYIGTLPAATMVEQWESHVAKVGGKVFALQSGEGSITFKVAETTFEILTAEDGIGQAPYFAKRQWVNVSSAAPLPVAELRAYLAASHRTVATGLTRKARAELGLAEAEYGRKAFGG